MNAGEIRERAVDDLKREVAAAQKEIWNLRFRRGSEKAGDPSKIRALRKDVARMLTILRERDLNISRSAAGSDAKK